MSQALTALRLTKSPQFIYNVDEKSCWLMLHHVNKVLAEKRKRRVYLLRIEHAESVTVVACINSLSKAILLMIIFKGIREKDTYSDNASSGSFVEVSAKDCMTSATFII